MCSTARSVAVEGDGGGSALKKAVSVASERGGTSVCALAQRSRSEREAPRQLIASSLFPTRDVAISEVAPTRFRAKSYFSICHCWRAAVRRSDGLRPPARCSGSVPPGSVPTLPSEPRFITGLGFVAPEQDFVPKVTDTCSYARLPHFSDAVVCARPCAVVTVCGRLHAAAALSLRARFLRSPLSTHTNMLGITGKTTPTSREAVGGAC